jgi:GH35 family endo-1,4-beta-xylanase
MRLSRNACLVLAALIVVAAAAVFIVPCRVQPTSSSAPTALPLDSTALRPGGYFSGSVMRERIARVRMGAVKITVTRAGAPVAGAQLKLEQVAHDFKFGCAIPTRRDLTQARCTDAQIAAIYDYIAAFGNSVTPENAFKIQSLSPKEGAWDFSQADEIVQWCIDHGKTMRLHNLISFTIPSWLSDYSGVEFQNKCAEYAATVLAHYKDVRLKDGRYLVYAADGFNEAVHGNRDLSSDFLNATLDAMTAAAKRDGEPMKLAVNEYGLIAAEPLMGYDFTEDGVRDFVDVLIPRFIAKLRDPSQITVGMQCHPMSTAYSADDLAATLDKLQAAGVKDVQVTECMFPSNGDAILSPEEMRMRDEVLKEGRVPPARARYSPQTQEKELTDLCRRCFSDPRISAFILWNLFDREGETDSTAHNISWRPKYKEAIITIGLDGAFHPKPAYYSLQRLVNTEWHTSLTLLTDTSGAADCTAFYGLYDCTITAGGTTLTQRLHVEKGHDNRFEIPLP